MNQLQEESVSEKKEPLNSSRQKLNYVLNFAIYLARDMLACGANLERANYTMRTICHHYGLKSISINSSSTIISLSAHTADGLDCVKQVSVPPCSLNMEKLKMLNALSFRVCREDIAPSKLRGLHQQIQAPVYKKPTVVAGYLIAMASLARIFGGNWQEILVALFNTVLLIFLTDILGKAKLNKIITNVACMFICSAIVFFFVYIGFVRSFYVVIITNAFQLIPGIPMVNSVRNILCGYEQNGILELLKVLLEVLSIVAGIAIAFYCFGNNYTALEDEIIAKPDGFLADVELVFISLTASLGFGIVFGISPKDLPYAALGGTIIRIVYLLIMQVTPYRIAYILVAAFCAALYAEILAYVKKMPSTVFLYPSIVPLIPGDLIYYGMLGVVWNNFAMFWNNISECILALVGMSVGFVLCSSFVVYVRRIRFVKRKNAQK